MSIHFVVLSINGNEWLSTQDANDSRESKRWQTEKLRDQKVSFRFVLKKEDWRREEKNHCRIEHDGCWHWNQCFVSFSLLKCRCSYWFLKHLQSNVITQIKWQKWKKMCLAIAIYNLQLVWAVEFIVQGSKVWIRNREQMWKKKTTEMC